jgi:hypothetical protein
VRRIDLYREDGPIRYQALSTFRKTVFDPFLEVLSVHLGGADLVRD